MRVHLRQDLSKLAFYHRPVRTGLLSTNKSSPCIGISPGLPGRLRIAQHAVLGVRSWQDQSRRED